MTLRQCITCVNVHGNYVMRLHNYHASMLRYFHSIHPVMNIYC